MLVRYCATHIGYFGYPRLLGVRWNGWIVSTAGGLCEACRERERRRWKADPYGKVLIPVPVELGPRTLGRRVVAVIVAGAAAGVVTTAALLVVTPSDLIPSGGELGHFASGARLAGPPQAQAETTEEPAASRSIRRPRAASRVTVSRAAPRAAPSRAAAEPVRLARGRAMPVAASPARATRPTLVAAQSP